MAAAAAEVKEKNLFLPQDIVQKSVGFSLDVGSSLTKTVYRSREDFLNGEPINEDAVKYGLARVYLFQIPRESGCKPVTDIINQKCDVTPPSDPNEKVTVAVTGVGANLFKDELEKQLNAERVVDCTWRAVVNGDCYVDLPLFDTRRTEPRYLPKHLVTSSVLYPKMQILFEDDCGASGFKLLAEITPVEDFLYPIPDNYKEDAEMLSKLSRGYFEAHNTTPHENYSKLTHCERPIPVGDKPFLPCLLVTYGSGTIIAKLDTKGEMVICDFNLVAGRAFLGFATHNHGPISFEDLNSKLENADGSSVDALMTDLIAEDSDSDYALLRTNMRVLPFAKLITNGNSNNVKKEDLTLSFLRSLAEVQGHLAHIHALAHQVRKVYFVGGFINMELMRRYLSQEINGRNLTRPESQQIEINFVRQGGHVNAIGAFAEGVKQKTKKCREDSLLEEITAEHILQ